MICEQIGYEIIWLNNVGLCDLMGITLMKSYFLCF